MSNLIWHKVFFKVLTWIKVFTFSSVSPVPANTKVNTKTKYVIIGTIQFYRSSKFMALSLCFFSLIFVLLLLFHLCVSNRSFNICFIFILVSSLYRLYKVIAVNKDTIEYYLFVFLSLQIKWYQNLIGWLYENINFCDRLILHGLHFLMEFWKCTFFMFSLCTFITGVGSKF